MKYKHDYYYNQEGKLCYDERYEVSPNIYITLTWGSDGRGSFPLHE
jgi:hypothetical protein